MNLSATVAAGQMRHGGKLHGGWTVTALRLDDNFVNQYYNGSLFELAEVLALEFICRSSHGKIAVHRRHTTCGCDDYGIVNMKPQLWNFKVDPFCTVGKY